MRLGVAGWPVAHSRSPAIYAAALAAAGLEGWRYQLLPIPPALFEETVMALPEAGFRGINVTIPHKERALALALTGGGTASDRARAIGAANTLVFDPGGRIVADNTDAPAFVAALSQALARSAGANEALAPAAGADGALAGVTALVLGAGGSARAAVWSLLDAGATEVQVWNRTPERAGALCESLTVAGRAARPVLRSVADRAARSDVLVNCTSVGLHGEGRQELFELPIDPDHLGYRILVDFPYRAGGTALASAAREQGITTVDGLELLVGQGALSFAQFTGAAASLQAMRDAVGL